MKLTISRFKLVIALLSLLMTLTVAGGVVVWQVLRSLEAPILIEEAQLVTVPSGTNYHHLLRDWQRQGIVAPSSWRRYAVKLEPNLAEVKSGTYELQPDMTVKQAIDLIVRGNEFQFSVTFIEGMNIRELRQHLSNAPFVDPQTAELSNEELMKRLGAEGEFPEGVFFPDTYNYVAGTSDLAILRRAYLAMEKTLAQAWSQREDNLPYEIAYDVLIMASIIEKETGDPSERPLIASVFINRLRKGMRLQTDPTVIYGMGERFNGNITRRDLRQETPYNTYVIRGLPPTPIAMPSRDAIFAAVNPAKSDYLYFVSKGNGTHYFSKTLSEHNRAVRKYILKRH